MSEIKNGALDQYGVEPFEQQQFRTTGAEGVNQQMFCFGLYRIHWPISLGVCNYRADLRF